MTVIENVPDGLGGDGAGAADPLRYPRPGAVAAGRYRLLDRVGRGASAEVWRAWDLRLARPVAVKLFRDGCDGDASSPARRSAEARLLGSLSHRHLVRVYDAFVPAKDADGDVAWIAMELVSGHTLRDLIARGPLPAELVAAIGRQLADALDYVHRCGAIHRDVKPANVLLADLPDGAADPGEPYVKLTDFGVARLLDDTRTTQDGFTVGTANYLSPEQVTGEACGPAVDVYALGLVLLEALTGRIAYPGVGAEAALARLRQPPYIPADVGPDWQALLAAMTARLPADRPPLTAVRDALVRMGTDSIPLPVEGAGSPLDGFFSTDSLLVVPAAPRSNPPRRRRYRAAVLLAAAGAAIAAASIAPLAFSGDSPQPSAIAGTPHAMAGHAVTGSGGPVVARHGPRAAHHRAARPAHRARVTRRHRAVPRLTTHRTRNTRTATPVTRLRAPQVQHRLPGPPRHKASSPGKGRGKKLGHAKKPH
jgi:tRNA A-37 threonylcarbamoyl transferase component Bud32